MIPKASWYPWSSRFETSSPYITTIPSDISLQLPNVYRIRGLHIFEGISKNSKISRHLTNKQKNKNKNNTERERERRDDLTHPNVTFAFWHFHPLVRWPIIDHLVYEYVA